MSDRAAQAGNQGDVAKHVALVALLQVVTRQRAGGTQPFVYAETHAGPPTIELPEKGEWTQALGPLSKHSDLAEARTQSDRRSAMMPFCHDFDRIAIGGEVSEGFRYSGSTELARRVITRDHGRPAFRLWEINATTAGRLEEHFSLWGIDLQVHRYDGISGLVGYVGAIDFALIDPFETDGDKICGIIQRLDERGIPYLAWQPRTATGSPKKDVESEPSKNVRSLCESVAHVEGLLWGDFTKPRVHGCWLIASKGLQATLKAVANELRSVMKWK